MSVNLLRYAQGENISDTLSSSIGSSDTSIPVNTISKWSSNGGNVIIDRGTSTQEIIVVTGVSGSSLVVASGGRGFDGTTAVGHNSGATIESVPFAKDWNDLISALLNLLVIAGTLDTTKVVDLTTAQTLTNKILGSGSKITLGSDAQGDIYYNNGTTLARLGPGTSGQFLQTQGASANPQWATSTAIANLYQNAIINGSCRVNQLQTTPSLSTSYVYAPVDMLAAKGSGTAVSAGTITQLTSGAHVGTSGYALKLSGVTITGTGIVYVRYRMEAKDAVAFLSQACSFSTKVYQDTGSAINYTIYVRYASGGGGADDFSSVTDIANSGSISVNSATATTIKFENINSGNIGTNVANGIEIEIQAACGAITTKNFEFAEFQFNQGSTAGTFYPRSFETDLRACQRYYEKSYAYATAAGASTTVGFLLTNYGHTTSSDRLFPVNYKVTKRATPTLTLYDSNGVSGKIDTCDNATALTGNVSPTSTWATDDSSFTIKYTSTGQAGFGFHFTADARL